MISKNSIKYLLILINMLILISGCSAKKQYNRNIDLTKLQYEDTVEINDNDSKINTKVKDNLRSSTKDTKNPITNDNPKKETVYKKVKALYLTGWTAGNEDKINYFIDLANKTEINAYVIDIKDDDGYVAYQSQLEQVKSANTWIQKYNVDSVIKKMHDNDIYVIGRLVCFNDPKFSAVRPDLAIKKSEGSLYRDNRNHTWLNPYKKESWDYLINLAKEAVNRGFDEIQFDYVRFPSDGNQSLIDYGVNGIEKHNIISEFLEYAKQQLVDVPVSADVYGIICESPGDTENIGQYLEITGKNIDAISPMVYPSHYAVGQVVNGVKYAKPDLEPYSVVYNTLIKAKERLSKVEGYNAKVRPYLQAFTATWLGNGYYQRYGAEQIKQQIKAVYDAGYDEWILWDPANKYPEEALMPE